MNAGACLTIDLEALAMNYRQLCRQVHPSRVAGVIKANGYGLGASEVARTLFDEGCRQFFVAHLSEALPLIADGHDPHGILVLNGLLPGSGNEFLQAGVIPVLNSLDQVEYWAAMAALRNRPLPAALQVDTGMSRLGLPADEIEGLLRFPDLLRGLDLRLVMSHLACADEPDAPANAMQWDVFTKIAEAFPGVPRALDNSGGCFLPRDHLELVRAGIALYGGTAQVGAAPPRPVVSLSAAIVQVRVIPPGTGIGYGLSFHADRETRIATIAVGYADGWPRRLGNKGSAFIAGLRVPIVGRVSMDSITLDVTGVPERLVYPGSEVELLGPNQSVDQVAADADTISYEILTQLGQRYERRYLPARSGRETRSQVA